MKKNKGGKMDKEKFLEEFKKLIMRVENLETELASIKKKKKRGRPKKTEEKEKEKEKEKGTDWLDELFSD